MKKTKFWSIVKKKFKVTTDSKHTYPVVENILNRAFNPVNISMAWVSNITYIKTKLALPDDSTRLDLRDRKVTGWVLSTTMRAIDTVIPAWKMAEKNRPITEPLIFHSDRGVQYACNYFKALLDANKFIGRSMSRKGNCWNNAVEKSFFKTLKTECVYRHKLQKNKRR
jgi:transposase InsO family protein